jgi:hypothetical protein
MRNRIACIAIAVLLGAGLAAAKATFTPLSGTAQMVAPPQGGKVNCFKGTATGTWPPCSPGSSVEIRGLNLTYRQEFRKANGDIDPLHTGFRTVVFNTRLDENGRGHSWGTWRVVLDNGLGEWEGVFTGSGDGWFSASDGQVTGHGTEGEVEGMQLRLFLSYETFPFDPTTGLPSVETIVGYRIDPKGGK